ncbi:hypothetical protein J4E91_010852 [Alternaria rosae]|nr:hypothetical protein J4E91_010852 [Alternaria rosae]
MKPVGYLDWCYRLSTNWILWCLVGDISKKEAHEIEHLSTVLPRIDSGIGIHLLGGNERYSIRPVVLKPPLPINFKFVFQDATTRKLLDYRVYSEWINVDALLHELAQDGIVVHELWNVTEDMQIASGDWDARIQPGIAIEARCFHDVQTDAWEQDSRESEVEDEMDGDSVGSDCKMSRRGWEIDDRSSHPWWFTRWRERVEKKLLGERDVMEKPSWFAIVAWYTSVVGIVVLVRILST